MTQTSPSWRGKAAGSAAAHVQGQVQALTQRSFILHVVIGGQHEDASRGVSAAEAQQGQQEPGARAPVPRLHDDVVEGEVRQLVLPEAPMLLGHDDQDVLPGNHAARAVDGPAEHGSRPPERAILFRDGSTGRIRRPRGEPQAVSSRQHDGPGVFAAVHLKHPSPSAFFHRPRRPGVAGSTVDFAGAGH
jgi:hypothetical protein